MTRRKALLLALCLLWMAVIFLFSAQDAAESTDLSDKVLDWLRPGETGALAIILLRKSAHFLEYAVLGVLYALLLREWTQKGRGWVLPAAAGLSFLYACTDELHQIFVPGRSGELRDVLIDTAGACFGLLIWTLLSALYRIFKHQKKE